MIFSILVFPSALRWLNYLVSRLGRFASFIFPLDADTLSLALEDHKAIIARGFLPQGPLQPLPHQYTQWESIVANLPDLISNQRLRTFIDSMPILLSDHLETESQWSRAYVLLIFMFQGYIWSGETPADRIPPQITIPLLEVCAHMALPPIGTYTGLCLWNYRKICPERSEEDPDNLTALFTFTGLADEEWFYLISVAIEARGARTIPYIIEGIRAAHRKDGLGLVKCLNAFKEGLHEIGVLLERMQERCDPHMFYYHIRPFLAGTKDMGNAGLPNGVLYDDGSDFRKYRQYSGGSNAQSPIIQLFDIVLGVEHRATGDQERKHSQPNSAHNFLSEMRNYMFGPHRQFLEDIALASNIREFVQRHPSDRALQAAYDSCLDMLCVLRERHIRMVTRYIVVESQKREERNCILCQCRISQTANVVGLWDEERAPTGGRIDVEKIRGTGGTALMKFLKQARDETSIALIQNRSRSCSST